MKKINFLKQARLLILVILVLPASLAYAQDFSVERPVFNGTNIPFSIKTEESEPGGITFSPDGLKMFIAGSRFFRSTDDEVNQFDLTTPFDVATATFTPSESNPFSIRDQTTQDTDDIRGITFSNDGLRMFILLGNGSVVIQYVLTEAYDLSTATFTASANNPFDVSEEAFVPTDIDFSNDGTRMFILVDNGDEINQYDLSQPFDVTTATFTSAPNNPLRINEEEIFANGINFSDDGMQMFIVGGFGEAEVNKYDLTQAFDITTATFTSAPNNPLNITNLAQIPTGITFSNDCQRMFIVDSEGDDVNQYDLTSPFDITSATFPSNPGRFEVSAEGTLPSDIAFSPDGLNMYVIGEGDGAIHQYNLSVAFDVSTASFTPATNNPLDLTGVERNPSGISFSADGTRMFVLGNEIGQAEISQYDLSTPFDITTATFTGGVNNPFNVSGQISGGARGITFSEDGQMMFLVGGASSTARVNKYSLSTSFDITTASFDAVTGNPFQIRAWVNQPNGIRFSEDGLRMFIVDNGNGTPDEVVQFSLTEPYNTTTARYISTVPPADISMEQSEPVGIAFSTDASRMFIIGRAGGEVLQYDMIPIPAISINAPIETDDVVNASEDEDVTISGTTTDIEDGGIVTVSFKTPQLFGRPDEIALSEDFVFTTTVSNNSWVLEDADISGFTNGTVQVTADVSNGAGEAPQASRIIVLDNVLQIESLSINTPIEGDNIIVSSEISDVSISGNTTRVDEDITLLVTFQDENDTKIEVNAVFDDEAWSIEDTDLSSLSGEVIIMATVSDEAGNESEVSETVIINSVPVIEAQTLTLAENSANGTVVGTVTASDANMDAIAYSITAGNTNEAFSINGGTGELTVNDSGELDFETTPSFDLSVEVSDGLESASVTVTVNLTDVDENVLGVIESDFEGLSLYPNPTTDGTINLSLNENFDGTVTLINAEGKSIKEIQARTDKVALKINGKAGLYFLKVQSSEGDKEATIRLIKK